jgi:hypothetical protein
VIVAYLSRRNASNQSEQLKRLQQKQKELFNPADPRHYYYYYYSSYLIRQCQHACNQLKQHQTQQQTFRLFQLDDVALCLGFGASLFHIFLATTAIEYLFVLVVPLLLTLILLRFKSSLSATFSLAVIVMALLVISNRSSTNMSIIRELQNARLDSSSNYLNNLKSTTKATTGVESLLLSSTIPGVSSK